MKLNSLYSSLFVEKFNVTNLYQLVTCKKIYISVVHKMVSSINKNFINRSLGVLRFLSFAYPKITKLRYFYVSKQKNFVYSAHVLVTGSKLEQFLYIYFRYLVSNIKALVQGNFLNSAKVLTLTDEGVLRGVLSNFSVFSRFKLFFYMWNAKLEYVLLFKNSNNILSKFYLSYFNMFLKDFFLPFSGNSFEKR